MSYKQTDCLAWYTQFSTDISYSHFIFKIKFRLYGIQAYLYNSVTNVQKNGKTKCKEEILLSETICGPGIDSKLPDGPIPCLNIWKNWRVVLSTPNATLWIQIGEKNWVVIKSQLTPQFCFSSYIAHAKKRCTEKYTGGECIMAIVWYALARVKRFPWTLLLDFVGIVQHDGNEIHIQNKS